MIFPPSSSLTKTETFLIIKKRALEFSDEKWWAHRKYSCANYINK